MTSQAIPPPAKLSDLILLAIKDARALDRSIYWPDYGVWHEIEVVANPVEPYVECHVCLAGAVIAETLGERPETTITGLSQVRSDWEFALDALDCVRRGRYESAFMYLHPNLSDFEVIDVFAEDPLPTAR